jgi:predicted 2-oxoglutarate/Fe(II)-dependent dioxygenase YbiX
MGKSPLGIEFVDTMGFSVVFRRESIGAVLEILPCLSPYFERTLFDSCNAFYLNPVLMRQRSRVDAHIDCRLISGSNIRIIPNLVSVLYVAVSEDSIGGSLILNVDSEHEIALSPKAGELVHFLGQLVHRVTELETDSKRLSLVCEQYNLSEESLREFPECQIFLGTDSVAPRVSLS